jgi:tRNA1(Val) A37 N6-methylase TrmN6
MKRSRFEPGEDETLDSFYHGRILVLQKRKGYRFSVDAPLLADFIRTRPADILLEVGAGNGIISLLLSLKRFRRIVCLEVQPGLAELARRNLVLNGLEKKMTVLEQDLRTFHSPEPFDVIFSNPPYLKKKGGSLSRSEEKSIAKHELHGDIFDIMRLVGELMKAEGRAYFIFPAAREGDFAGALETNRLKIRVRRFVHSRSGEDAHWFLAECGFAAASPFELPPLFLYDETGEYTPEMKKIFAGERRDSPN